MGKLTEKELSDLIKTGKSHIREWKNMAKESYDFLASEQWSTEDKAVLEEMNRPPVVFNRIARTINVVSGLEVQNRQEIRYIPREQTDTGVNDLLSSAAKWSRDNCDAEDEQSEAFQDLLIAGMGWTETRMDYEEDPDGVIKEDRVDPMEMIYDPTSKKRNLDDAQWAAQEKRYTKRQFEELWPGQEEIVFTPDDELITEDDHDASDAWKYENDQTDDEQKKALISVIKIQYYQKEPFYRAVDPTSGKIIELSVNKFKKIEKVMPIRGVKQRRRRYYQAFLANGKILEHEDGPSQKGFTFRCMTGIRHRNKNIWLGLVELMKDPQRWANKWLSQMMHILNSNAKGGLLAETGAFTNPRKAEEDWANSEALIQLNEGGLQKIQQREAPQLPTTLDKLLTHALESINEVPGVSLELMGLTGRDQAGVLELQRKQSGITILAVFFDALRRFRKEQGRILADFIQTYISDGRLIRVAGDEGAQYVPLLRDQLTYKYDVVLDDTPSSPNQKERVFTLMSELIPIFQAAGQPLPPEFMDYLPLPESVTMKIKQRMSQGNPLQEKAQQLELEEKQIKNVETATKAQLNLAKAEKEGAVSQDELAQAALKKDQMINDFHLRREKNYLDAAVKRESNQMRKQNVN